MSNKSYYSAQFNLFGYPHFQVETWYSLAIPKYWTSMKMCLIKKIGRFNESPYSIYPN